ncbi:MAG: hypothetical protein Q9218_006681, partial [Villophora microphyllina]
MATVLPMAFYDGLRDNGSIRVDIPQPKIGLDDMKSDMSTWRCDSVSLERALTCNSSTPLMSWPLRFPPPSTSKYTKSAELKEIIDDTSCLDIEPPPSYSASIADNPPLYDSSPTAVPQHKFRISEFHDWLATDCSKRQWQADLYNSLPPIHSMTSAAIDLNDTSNFRQAAGAKKAKKAQKQADQAKWAGDGDEGAKDGGDGGDNAGGGGGAGGGSNNGDDGGADDWNTGGGKKKKGKKGKNAVDEEEEKRKKEEEEENKRNEEEANGAPDPLAWMNDGATGAEDDWGGFTTTTDKKSKKNKKGKASPEPPIQNTFDEISLDDTPRINLSFGTETDTKTAGSGFGFGGWGSSWNTSNALGTGATDITDSNNTGDSGIWSFGKNKKKTTGSLGFDFGNFDAVNETPETQATAGGEQDDWATGGFTASGKKNKKNKKTALDDFPSTDTAAI